MIFPGFPGVLSFFQVFQVFQVEWEPCNLIAFKISSATDPGLPWGPLTYYFSKMLPKMHENKMGQERGESLVFLSICNWS